MKIRVIIFVATIALLVSPAMGAKAATTVASQTTFNAGQACVQSGSPLNSNTHQKINFDITTEFDAFTYEQMFSVGGATGTVTLEVMQTTYNGTIIATSTNSLDVSTLPTSEGAAVPFTWLFSPPVSLTLATDYYIGIHPSNDATTGLAGMSAQNVLGNAVFDPASGYTADRVNGCGAGAGSDATKVTLFTMEAGVGAPANAIVVPVDLSTVTTLPFDISGTCDSATQNQLEVELTEVGSPLNRIDRKFVTCELSDTWDVGTMGAAAWDSDFLVTLYDIVEGTFGTRNLPSLDEITVTVAVVGNTNEPPPVIDPAATDDDFGFLGNLIRDALIFLFIPNEEALSRFADLFALIADKPPIGFITATVAAFEDLEVGTPVETLDGTAALSDYFDPIRTAISAFLFLLFALYLINRVSRITI